MPLHQSGKQTFCRCRIAPALKDFVQNDPMLVNRPPQPELTVFDRDNDFIQMPDIAGLRLSAAQSARNGWPEFCNPSTDGFVGNVDTPFQKYFLHIAKAQIEPAIQPDRMAMISGGKRWRL